MGNHISEKIRHLIEQTSDVFENYGGVNTDYADFATIALSDFKLLLGNPHLTDRQLKRLIRAASRHHKTAKTQHETRDSWSSFTAHYISRKANSNEQLA